MSQNSIVKTDISINRDAEYVWKWLFSPENLKTIVDFPLSADLKSTGGGGYRGTVVLGRTRFESEISPQREIVLKNSGRALSIRVVPEGSRCRAVMVSASPEGRGTVFTEACMNGILRRLRSRTELAGARSFSYDDAVSRYASGAAFSSDDSGGGAAAPEDGAGTRTRPAPAQRTAVRRRIAALAVVALLLTAGVFAWIKLSRRAAEPGAAAPLDLSGGVTLQNALSVSPGQSRADIERLFGTSGVADGGAALYRCDTLDGMSRPTVQVKVDYKGDAAERITYLNLEAGGTIPEQPLTAPDGAHYGMGVPELEQTVGAPLSMMRAYTDPERGDVREYHFGYTDPFANFSPSWRGEIVVTMTSADSGCAVKRWMSYDGSDPLMIGSLEGEAAAFQYDDYDEFLDDKFMFDYSLLMLNRYSRGDLRAVFGEMSEYDGGGAYNFYHIDSAETLGADGGQSPVWRMSFGLDTRGAFKVGSYVNLRLMTREGQLEGCEPSKVAMGMSYSEVREYLPVLPTVLSVNEGGYTLCYGMWTDGKSSTEEQYEFVLKFGLDNKVSGIYNNTGMNNQGSISTNDPLAKTE